MGNIVDFTGETTLPIHPDRILKNAIGELETVVICGWDKDDNIYFAMSDNRKADVLYIMEICKQLLME